MRFRSGSDTNWFYHQTKPSPRPGKHSMQQYQLGELPLDTTAGVRAVYQVWNKVRAGRRMPCRADIDPASINPEILPHILIADFEPQPFRVRFRLVGTKLVESAGQDFTGRYLDEMDWPMVKASLEVYRKVWETGKPAFGSFGAELTIGGWYSISFALLPLMRDADAGSGDRPEKCLVVVDYLGLDLNQAVQPTVLALRRVEG